MKVNLAWFGLACGALVTVGATSSASQLVSQGDAHLSAGNLGDAIDNYDSAIRLDPSNYLYVFKRGAALLSLGRDLAAIKDFDRVLELQPAFEGALSQRAKTYLKTGKLSQAGADAAQLTNEAQRQDILAKVEVCQAEWPLAVAASQPKGGAPKDAEACILHSSRVLTLAPGSTEMRLVRAHCRLAHGDYREALVDLSQAGAQSAANPEPFATAALVNFYIYHQYDAAMQGLRRCLQYDPDSKVCLSVRRSIKKAEKRVGPYVASKRDRKVGEHPIWAQLTTALVTEGLLNELQAETVESMKKAGLQQFDPADSELLSELTEGICEAFYNQKKYSEGLSSCQAVLARNSGFVPAILLQADLELEKDNFERAAQILHDAHQGGVNDPRVRNKMQEAQMLAQRATQKDYYKVLGVPRNADEKEVKKAYRGLTKQFHPDKYRGDMKPEDVERKMAEINEAYEVLSDAEKRQQFDAGHDPNNPNGGHGGFHGGGFRQQGFQGGFDFGAFQQQFQDQFMKQQGGNAHFQFRQ